MAKIKKVDPEQKLFRITDATIKLVAHKEII